MPTKGYKSVTIKEDTEDVIKIIIDLVEYFGKRALGVPEMELTKMGVVTYLVQEFYKNARQQLEDKYGSQAVAEVITTHARNQR